MEVKMAKMPQTPRKVQLDATASVALSGLQIMQSYAIRAHADIGLRMVMQSLERVELMVRSFKPKCNFSTLLKQQQKFT
jgi:hypothetical protein